QEVRDRPRRARVDDSRTGREGGDRLRRWEGQRRVPLRGEGSRALHQGGSRRGPEDDRRRGPTARQEAPRHRAEEGEAGGQEGQVTGPAGEAVVELLEFAANVGLALLLGTLIGLERQLTQHPAGLRTNALVAVGAALFVSLTRLMGGEPASPTRVASYIVVGIGFLGGGVIFKEGGSVRGLTTAAGVWCSAAVGTLAGAGFGWHAAVGTALVLVVLIGFVPLDNWLGALHRRLAGRAA